MARKNTKKNDVEVDAPPARGGAKRRVDVVFFFEVAVRAGNDVRAGTEFDKDRGCCSGAAAGAADDGLVSTPAVGGGAAVLDGPSCCCFGKSEPGRERRPPSAADPTSRG